MVRHKKVNASPDGLPDDPGGDIKGTGNGANLGSSLDDQPDPATIHLIGIPWWCDPFKLCDEVPDIHVKLSAAGRLKVSNYYW
jgi:hypothetical protein